MPHPSSHLPETVVATRKRRLRFDRIVHLDSGDQVAATAVTDMRFSERAAFGPAAAQNEQASPATWLADAIQNAAAGAMTVDLIERPIHIAAPMTALAHENTAIACDAAVRQTRFCAQEFVIEFEDAATQVARHDLLTHIESLRRRGFRIALDARKSFETKLCSNLRLMLDTVRIEADAIWSDPSLQDKVALSREAGMDVIAQNAKYRDSEALIRLGVEYGSGLKADA